MGAPVLQLGWGLRGSPTEMGAGLAPALLNVSEAPSFNFSCPRKRDEG